MRVEPVALILIVALVSGFAVSEPATMSESSKTPDFSLAATPTHLETIVGKVTESKIGVTGVNGFTGIISLSLPYTYLPCDIVPSQITESGVAFLTCKFANATDSGNVLILAKSGSLLRQIRIPVVVSDFKLDASYNPVLAAAGRAASSIIRVNSLVPFQGAVVLRTDRQECQLSLNMTSASEPGSVSTLTCTFDSPGIYPIEVTATSLGVAHSISIVYDVSGFIVTSSPRPWLNSCWCPGLAGTALPLVVNITSHGYIGTVRLTATPKLVSYGTPESKMTCNVQPATLKLATNTSTVLSTLTCEGTGGVYDVVVTGTSMDGSMVISTHFGYGLYDYELRASSGLVNANLGDVGKSRIQIIPTGLDGFHANVTLSVNTSSKELDCTASPEVVSIGYDSSLYSALLSCKGHSPGSYFVTLTGNYRSLSRSVTIEFVICDL